MKSEALGQTTSAVEVTNISRHGFWILVEERELFVPFSEFPWFQSSILNVELLHTRHLYWPDLDVDLSMESVEHPERFPLVSKVERPTNPFSGAR